MLSDCQRSELRTHILAQLNETDSLIASLQESSQPVQPDNAIGRLSRMEAIHDQQMLQANLRSAEARKIRLQRALAEIDSDEYGICVRCEETIAFERLRLIPESRVCVACAS